MGSEGVKLRWAKWPSYMRLHLMAEGLRCNCTANALLHKHQTYPRGMFNVFAGVCQLASTWHVPFHVFDTNSAQPPNLDTNTARSSSMPGSNSPLKHTTQVF